MLLASSSHLKPSLVCVSGSRRAWNPQIDYHSDVRACPSICKNRKLGRPTRFCPLRKGIWLREHTEEPLSSEQRTIIAPTKRLGILTESLTLHHCLKNWKRLTFQASFQNYLCTQFKKTHYLHHNLCLSLSDFAAAKTMVAIIPSFTMKRVIVAAVKEDPTN